MVHDTSENGTDRPISNIPLADYCSLCAGGYHPNLQIEIAEDPRERNGSKEYGWVHRHCRRDHEQTFSQAVQDGTVRTPETGSADSTGVE
jgi:hypothetical protein